MKKIGAEIRYDNAYQTALTQVELLKKKVTKQRMESIRELIKEMDKCITRIEQDFYGNSKINKKDAENKVNIYKGQRKNIREILDTTELAFQQKQLFQHTPNPNLNITEERLKAENRELAEKQADQVKNTHKMLIEVKTITKDTVAELHNQGEVEEKINNDVEEAEGELSMINEFMSIISNRNLLTRLILLALALFLGLADLVIIILKIS